jgi:predicted metal-dependent HD superfamily phosphohydrolase
VARLFHDVIYNTTANENEKKSWQLACEILRKYWLNEPMILRVYDLIMWTTHSSALVDSDQQLLADIDLSILARESDRYAQYTQSIRKEYSQYSDEQYNIW